MIYAPLEERIKNSVNELRIPEYEVTDYVKEIDRARDSYHKFFTDEKLDTIKYRDMLIDSSTMSQDEIASLKLLKENCTSNDVLEFFDLMDKIYV